MERYLSSLRSRSTKHAHHEYLPTGTGSLRTKKLDVAQVGAEPFSTGALPLYVGHMPELSEPEALMVPSEWICTAPQGLEVTAGPVLATYRQRTGPVEPAAAGGRCQAVERQTVPLAFRAFRGDHKGRLRDKVVHRFGHQGRVSPGPQAPQRARECSYPS